MQITLNLGRWTKLHTVVALCGALAIAGVIGRASAVSPTIEAPIKWTGGIPSTPMDFFGAPKQLYKVPAGNNFMLTDLIIANFGSSVAKEMNARLL